MNIYSRLTVFWESVLMKYEEDNSTAISGGAIKEKTI
jgi:hypothetical protein